jgi:predicted RNA polymerase sigma factor
MTYPEFDAGQGGPTRDTLPVINDGANINGTTLQGTIKTTFGHLVATLGEPLRDGDKSTAEWHLDFPDGVVVTIYDWANSNTPEGPYEWHIGGISKDAVDRVSRLLGLEA